MHDFQIDCRLPSANCHSSLCIHPARSQTLPRRFNQRPSRESPEGLNVQRRALRPTISNLIIPMHPRRRAGHPTPDISPTIAPCARQHLPKPGSPSAGPVECIFSMAPPTGGPPRAGGPQYPEREGDGDHLGTLRPVPPSPAQSRPRCTCCTSLRRFMPTRYATANRAGWWACVVPGQCHPASCLFVMCPPCNARHACPCPQRAVGTRKPAVAFWSLRWLAHKHGIAVMEARLAPLVLADRRTTTRSSTKFQP